MVGNDHVVPRTLWPGRPRDRVPFVIVPACCDCNTIKSKGEDDLRDYVVLDKDGRQHPQSLRLLGKVVRSVAKGHANIGKAALSAEMRPLITKHGIYLGDYPAADIDSTNMIVTLRMMVRGLYFHETDTILPPKCPVDVWVIPSYSIGVVFEPFAQPPHLEPRVLGDYVFWWVPFIADDEPTASAWPMGIFDRVAFVGATGSRVGEHQS